MIYGYARVSTSTQRIDRQIKNIERYAPDAKIYKEHFTGTRIDRPEWNKLSKRIQPGDTIVFDEVSRMSRNASEGFLLYKELFEQDVSLVFLKEPHINTESYRSAMSLAFPTVQTGDEAAQELLESVLTAIHKFMLAKVEQDIFGAFDRAQKEVDFLHQRTREGIEVARESGKRIGLPKGSRLVTEKSIKAKEIIRKHCVTFGGALCDKDCAKLAGVSRNTYFKYKREMLDEKVGL